MAYSNTNKDKEQGKRRFSLTNLGILLFGLVLTATSLRNIVGQVRILESARTNLTDISNKSADLEQFNLTLEEEIKYATSSMGRKRNQVRYYGMGTNDDYWIIRPKNANEGKSVTGDAENGLEVENWMKWWRLFTK